MIDQGWSAIRVMKGSWYITREQGYKEDSLGRTYKLSVSLSLPATVSGKRSNVTSDIMKAILYLSKWGLPKLGCHQHTCEFGYEEW